MKNLISESVCFGDQGKAEIKLEGKIADTNTEEVLRALMQDLNLVIVAAVNQADCGNPHLLKTLMAEIEQMKQIVKKEAAITLITVALKYGGIGI